MTSSIRARALPNIADLLAIPFLFDRLSREINPYILDLDVRALHNCAGNTQPRMGYQTPQQTAKSVVYWQQWAVDHKTQVDALRARFVAH